MKVALVGSRNYSDLEAVRRYVATLPKNTMVVSGGATGVDTAAEETAKQCGLLVKVFPADWNKYGKKAGVIRNEQIVLFADRVVAFWDGVSKGTESTIALARRYGKPCEVNPAVEAPVISRDSETRKTLLHFEASRCHGTFSCHNMSSLPDEYITQFKAWKKAPLAYPEFVAAMAEEIASHLLSVFGGSVPANALLIKPPRGQTPESEVHAIEVLARAVADRLQIAYCDCIKRNVPDTTAYKGRSRMNNLNDTSVFLRDAAAPLSSDRLVIVLDDVSTTGHTLQRMRTALSGISHLLFAYIIWH